jgi:mannose-1-phosphate guanylyltransferase/mannose-6-phosphate isomerase
MQPDIVPVILAGGAGRRLWPLSTDGYPKPFLKMPFARWSMLQETAQRVRPLPPPVIVCNVRHHEIVARQMDEAGIMRAQILLEPAGRNTAPAIAAAAHYLASSGRGAALMLVLPSDHMIRRPDIFLRAAGQGMPHALQGKIVTFGITPDHPAEGYGYIRTGILLDKKSGALSVASFHEKPSRAVAESYLAAGDRFWNSGIFLLGAQTCLDALQQFSPDIYSGAREAVRRAAQAQNATFLAEAAFTACPALSFDRAIMEKAENGALVPVAPGWRDLGTWRSYAGAFAASLLNRS